MNEAEDFLERNLPAFLLRTDKDRIKDGLLQFIQGHYKEAKNYDHFYLQDPPKFFMQGDLINSLPVVNWNPTTSKYDTFFSSVMLISNSCDVTQENNRLSTKEALFAPLVSLRTYFKNLQEAGFSKDQIDSLYNEFKNQKITNVYYLPPNHINSEEYLAFLDKVCWHPSMEFANKLKLIDSERFLSLANFGYYLLIFKLSIHFCRVPEEVERSSSIT